MPLQFVAQGPVQIPATGLYTGPGDIVSSPHWWGLRAYSAATCGTPCIDVKDTTGTLGPITINSLTTGGLNEAALASAITTFGTSACVVKVYDQGTVGGWFFAQGTIGNAPRMITNDLNGHSTMAFVKSIPQAIGAAASGLGADVNQPITVTGGIRVSNSDSPMFGWDNGGGVTGAEIESFNIDPNWLVGTSTHQTPTATWNHWHYLLTLFNSTSSKFSVDGSSPGTIDMGGTGIVTTATIDWGFSRSGHFADAKATELGLNFNDISGSAAALYANHIGYWGILP